MSSLRETSRNNGCWELADFAGFSAQARAFAQLDFALDFADELRRNADELHANANIGQTMTDFAARADLGAGQREAEAEMEHGAFGKPCGRSVTE